MIDIAFLTTNNIKLAHARYLCRNFYLNIIQHKLLHYGKGYEEPRLFEREKLLEESVKDAILRWKKNVSETENRLYFLEDTSVKIHALSTEEEEIPGVDIKYWMYDNTFEKIDLELKNKGNNRKVTVYSHLILVLTKDLKQQFGKDHVIFKSQSEGYFIEKEEIFNTNKIYPWLDNKSFNKWFVPEGESVPISMLSIEKADVYDFRKGAFDEMLFFLSTNNKIHVKRNEGRDCRFTFNPLFIVSGPTCAGKTTIGKYLLEKYNYFHIEASDFMSLEFLETHGNKTDIDIGEFAKEVLIVKPHIVVDRIFKYLEDIPNVSSLVITGLRTPSEIEYFKAYSPLKGNIIAIYIDSDYETRFNRWLNRNRDLNYSSKLEFDNSNRLQKELGLEIISQLDNISHIENIGSFDEYYSLFYNSFLNDILEGISQNLDISKVVPRNLEDAILLTLANDFKSNDQISYTTTELSHKINQTFNNLLKEKHKDNVSRYFNQRFYPFYKIKRIDDKNKYRLSPTGYSKAIWLINSSYY